MRGQEGVGGGAGHEGAPRRPGRSLEGAGRGGPPRAARRGGRTRGGGGRGGPPARQDGRDGGGYDRGGARGDRARRHHRELLVRHERAPLHLRGRGRGDPYPKGEEGMKIKAVNGFARILKSEGTPWVSCYPTSPVNNALGEEGMPIL